MFPVTRSYPVVSPVDDINVNIKFTPSCLRVHAVKYLF